MGQGPDEVDAVGLGRGGVGVSAYPTWLPGVNWLYGYYNYAYGGSLRIGSNPVTIRSAYAMMTLTQMIADLNASPLPGGWLVGVANASLGTLRIYGGSPETLTAVDRLLFALGFDLDCGETQAAATEFVSRCPSPLAIALQHCEMQKVDRVKERSFKLATFRRGHGDPYGKGDIWRFNVLLDAPAMRALKVGYGMGGRVMVSPYTLSEHISGFAQAWSPGDTGYIDGQLIGFESGDWEEPTVRQFYRASFLVAKGVY